MACLTVFAPAMAMATTELTRVIHYAVADPWRLQTNPERRHLRMNWVVATDDHGSRILRMLWTANAN